LAGVKWGEAIGRGATISYSFPGATAAWDQGYDDYHGYTPTTNSEQAAFRSALQAWANVANVQFQEVPDTPSNVGDIRIAWNDAFDTGASAYAYGPGSSPESGDVWLDNGDRLTSFEDGFAESTFGFYTLLHETGHALGLKHPFEGPAAISPEYDSIDFTVMSYSEYAGAQRAGADFYPTTPMWFDLWAMQYIYGPNLSFRAGDDVYVFSDTQKYWQTIWDAGGSDTIQYIGSSGAVIDLRPGNWWQVGSPISFSDGSQNTESVVIYSGVSIENAHGGSGDDEIWGNEWDNSIVGGGGRDTLIGYEGSDFLHGNTGADSIAGGVGNDELRGGRDDDVVRGGAGQDFLQGALGNDELRGGLDGDALFAGQGNDTLYGGGGDDYLDGKAHSDVLTGGAGADQFVFSNTPSGAGSADTIRDFEVGVDRFVLDVLAFGSLAAFPAGHLAARGFVSSASAVAQDADDYILYDTATHVLSYDVDGNGVGAAQPIAVLENGAAISAADILIV
jgi:serralysin